MSSELDQLHPSSSSSSGIFVFRFHVRVPQKNEFSEFKFEFAVLLRSVGYVGGVGTLRHTLLTYLLTLLLMMRAESMFKKEKYNHRKSQ